MTNVKFSRRPLETSFNTFVDDLFSELPVFFNNQLSQSNRKGSVPVNVKETDKAYEMEVVAPGFEKADFKIQVEQDMLTISADTPASHSGEKNNEGKYSRREYSYSSFKRSFTLDEKIDATNIAASYINGVLTLNLPKKETVKATKKEITIS